MTKPRPNAHILAGWLLTLGMTAVAQGQYQDVIGDSARTFGSDRTQSNISDQGTGYSPSQLSLYGPYYNRLLNSQNNATSPYQFRSTSNRDQGRLSGLPNQGLPLGREPSRLSLRRAASPDALGATFGEIGGQLVALHIRDDSPLAHAGLKPGDRIETVNGKVVRSPEEFQFAIGALAVGQEVQIVVIRGEGKETLKWTPQADELRPTKGESTEVEPSDEGPSHVDFITAALLGWDQQGKSFLGVTLDDQVADQVVVRKVVPGSPAQRAGLQAGDRIYSMSGLTVNSPKDLRRIVEGDKPGTSVYLYVGRASSPSKSPSGAHD
jgi:S1-C subfamily serine protease